MFSFLFIYYYLIFYLICEACAFGTYLLNFQVAIFDHNISTGIALWTNLAWQKSCKKGRKVVIWPFSPFHNHCYKIIFWSFVLWGISTITLFYIWGGRGREDCWKFFRFSFTSMYKKGKWIFLAFWWAIPYCYLICVICNKFKSLRVDGKA